MEELVSHTKTIKSHLNKEYVLCSSQEHIPVL